MPNKTDQFSCANLKFDKNFLQSILNHSKADQCNSHPINFYSTQNAQKLSIHFISASYTGDKSDLKIFVPNH